MRAPIIFGVYGASNSGKTTLLVQLVTQLSKQGYRVATIKQTNKAISMDTHYKDTWRHHHAGAHLVVFSSACETNFLLNTPLTTSDILKRISAFGDFDIILIEGANDPDIPKIQVGGGRKRPNTIAVYDNNFQDLIALMKKRFPRKKEGSNLLITVNGKRIPLTEFPTQIISNTIIGMLGSLKHVEAIKEVTIELQRS